MRELIDHLQLSDPNVQRVLLGTVLCASASALAGTFSVLRRRALAADAIAHAVLPGICLAFVLQGSKEPLGLLLGAFATGALSVWVVDALARHTRLREDAALALVLSVFFGVGVLLLTAIQQSGAGAQSGLDRMLFGKAAALTRADVLTFGLLAVGLAAAVVVLGKEFALLSFDPLQAQVLGLPVRALELLLSGLTVLAVVVGIQAVGVVLMAALLFAPAAAARYWTHRLPVLLLLAAGGGALAGVVGTYASLAAPAMPTGPWMVVTLGLLTLGSVLLAPERGVLARAWRRRSIQRRMTDENVLKALYQLDEAAPWHESSSSGPARPFFATEAIRRRNQPLQQAPEAVVTRALRRLEAAGDVVRLAAEPRRSSPTWNPKWGPTWRLTDAGRQRARRLVKLHRLWEVYLTERLRLPPDHVHDDAETIEHLLTPELEAELERILQRPAADPHQRDIPY